MKTTTTVNMLVYRNSDSTVKVYTEQQEMGPFFSKVTRIQTWKFSELSAW